MGKKRRSHGINVDGSDQDSTESGDGSCKTSDCPHFLKINISNLRKVLRDRKVNNVCIDCQKSGDIIIDNEDGFSNEPPQLWICLQCGHSACGRGEKSHALKHYETPRSDNHYIVMDTVKWSAWCYKCDNEINDRNTMQKKKLLEITDSLKKWVNSNRLTQPKVHIPLCQNELLSNDKGNKKILNDLPKVCGLTNLGNTCFFNAVLQCLAQTPYLVKVLDDLQVPGQTFVLPGGKLKGTDDEEIELQPIEGVLEKTGSFTPVLRQTLTEIQNFDGQVYKPAELLNSLRKKMMQCTDGGQHDSHELLRHLLELVRTEDVRRYQAVILKEVGLSHKTKPEGVDDNLKSRVKFFGNHANAKLLGPERVFRGELVSTLECLKCGHSSSRTEPFLDLSLPVLVDKSLPPTCKRKNASFEKSMDSMGNNVSSDTLLRELKKERDRGSLNRKKLNRTNNRENSNISSNSFQESEEKIECIIESEESDADVEDNIENEDAPIPEVGESGYSSQKLSTVTSPISTLGFEDVIHKIYKFDLNKLNEGTIAVPSYNFTNFSRIDIQKTDLTENKKNGTCLSLATSLVVNSDFTSPEDAGPTVSPLSSPLTSNNDSPTSPISSNVDVDDTDKDKLILRLDNGKNGSSGKEDSEKKVSVESANDNSTINKENNKTKKLTNGIGDITSNIKELDLSSPSVSPTRYPTKEGECSIQLCLNQFTAVELMDGNNKVGCTACTERANKGKKEGVKMVCTDSTKQYLISRVPAVLILHLKRFQVQKFSFRKVGKHVSFPMLLDLAPVSKDYTKPRIYALYGIVEHSGTLYGGHYVAYVKSRAPLKPNDPRWSFLPTKDGFDNQDSSSSESNSELESDEASGNNTPQVEPPPGKWYYVSDSRVHEVDEKTVLGSEAYLLFYERIL